MRKIIIAIDGYSSTGKSTIAKRLAKALSYIYIDTGAMYRAVTLYALREGLLDEKEQYDVESLLDRLPKIDLQFIRNPSEDLSEMYLNGENVERAIRTLEVSKQVSQVARIPEVRNKLVQMQREMGNEKGVVMDGRDIGTVVFPHAEIKIFMTASPEKRAQRRYKELLNRGEQVRYGEVLRNVEKRDFIDSNRKHSPLKRAGDAVMLDNSDMGLEEQFQRLYNYCLGVLENKKGTL
ncbi:MAG: (d)CMP kinase [Bacteroidota bacterium]